MNDAPGPPPSPPHRPTGSEQTGTPESARPRRAIIAGYGPVGRFVCDRLREEGVEVTVVDVNPATIKHLTARGRRAVQGSVTDRAVLEAAGVRGADALVLAVPNEDDALAACRLARELAPSIFISARTNFVSKGMLCTQAGADHVVVEELVTAEAMRHAVVDHLAPALPE